MSENKAMHAEHANGRFSNGGLALSFAMGPSLGSEHVKPSWNVVANRTPPGGDDGIDEQTSVRFVLVPKTTPNGTTSSQ